MRALLDQVLQPFLQWSRGFFCFNMPHIVKKTKKPLYTYRGMLFRTGIVFCIWKVMAPCPFLSEEANDDFHIFAFKAICYHHSYAAGFRSICLKNQPEATEQICWLRKNKSRSGQCQTDLGWLFKKALSCETKAALEAAMETGPDPKMPEEAFPQKLCLHGLQHIM